MRSKSVGARWIAAGSVTLAVATLGVGCDALVGIKQGTLAGGDDGGAGDVTVEGAADVTTSGDGAHDSSANADTGSTDSGSIVDTGNPDASPCSLRTVDDATGIFVRTGSTDTSTCGDRTDPCGTVQAGITQAKLLGKATVYVARGTYTESIDLQPGVSVEGGWDVLVTTWQPVCGTDELSTVTIQAPDTSNVTVTASTSGGVAGLRLMTVSSKATALPGETLYGVMASGGAQVTLDTVVINIAAGGVGGAGATGGTGGAGVTGCAPGGGQVGASGSSPAPAAAGTFTETGYESVSGAPATNGQVGGVGTCTLSPPCVTVCNPPTCSMTCASNATAGCGGLPGGGGGGGGGGGSSVAVFEWNAQVTVLGGSLSAGNGGNGGNGGTGGPGGAGGPAASGLVLCIGCSGTAAAPSCNTVGDQTAEAEGPGGTGGAGGLGGGGAGGSSFAIYEGGDAGVVTVQSAPLLAHGIAGTGGTAGGPPGQAADQAP